MTKWKKMARLGKMVENFVVCTIKKKSDLRSSRVCQMRKKWRGFFQRMCFSCFHYFRNIPFSHLISPVSLWFIWLSVECKICWGSHSSSVTTEPPQRELQGTGLKMARCKELLFEAIDMKLRPCKVELSIPQQTSNERKKYLVSYWGKWTFLLNDTLCPRAQQDCSNEV